MLEANPNLPGLGAALRLKTDLLRNFATRPFAEWPDHLASFIAAVEACDLRDPTALMVLLADLLEEIRTFMGPQASVIEAGSGAAVSDASSREGILAQFRFEIGEWLAAPVRHHGIASTPVDRLMRFIDEHYAERLTLDVLALAAGRSKRQVTALLRRQTGQTVHRYLTRVRVHHAAALIRQGEKIEAVSLLVGYRSKKDLYRHFREQIGVTPVVYKTAFVSLLLHRM